MFNSLIQYIARPKNWQFEARLRYPTRSTTTSLWKRFRQSAAMQQASTTASGSSAFTLLPGLLPQATINEAAHKQEQAPAGRGRRILQHRRADRLCNVCCVYTAPAVSGLSCEPDLDEVVVSLPAA